MIRVGSLSPVPDRFWFATCYVKQVLQMLENLCAMWKSMVVIIMKDLIEENQKKEVFDIEKKHLFKAHKHCGVIKWNKEPVKHQKALRDEWLK